MRINAILSEDIIKEIDAIAKEEKKSRSRLLREAVEKPFKINYKKIRGVGWGFRSAQVERRPVIKAFFNIKKTVDHLANHGTLLSKYFTSN